MWWSQCRAPPAASHSIIKTCTYTQSSTLPDRSLCSVCLRFNAFLLHFSVFLLLLVLPSLTLCPVPCNPVCSVSPPSLLYPAMPSALSPVPISCPSSQQPCFPAALYPQLSSFHGFHSGPVFLAPACPSAWFQASIPSLSP